MQKAIRKYTSNKNKSHLKSILVPKDSTLNWNQIPKNLPSNQWKEINDPESINACLIQQKLAHFNQAQSTPCTNEPLSSLLQDDSFTSFGNEILNGTANLNNKLLSPLQIMFFKELKQQTHLPSSPLQPNISLDQMIQ